MSISALATYTQLSPNCNKPRKNPISSITPHHMAGSLSLPQFGALVAKPSRQMSANYAIAKDGSIGAFCDEDNRSWCSSSPYNDHRAVTIEVANDGGASTNWHVSDAALESLVKLCVDICQRNPGLKNGLNYTGDARGNLTKHSYFTATACPGNYLGEKFAWLAGEVNKRLLGTGQENVELRAGTALHLERANLYVASTSLTIAGVRTGVFYLWGKEVVNGRVRITNTTSNVGKAGRVTGWISYDDAKAAAGIKDQLNDSRGLSTIVIDAVGTVTAMPLYELCKQLDLVNPGYYRAKFIDAANTVQYIEVGRISSGDAQVIKRLCDKAGIEYKVAA